MIRAITLAVAMVLTLSTSACSHLNDAMDAAYEQALFCKATDTYAQSRSNKWKEALQSIVKSDVKITTEYKTTYCKEDDSGEYGYHIVEYNAYGNDKLVSDLEAFTLFVHAEDMWIPVDDYPITMNFYDQSILDIHDL